MRLISIFCRHSVFFLVRSPPPVSATTVIISGCFAMAAAFITIDAASIGMILR
jgi:hypothetical protein